MRYQSRFRSTIYGERYLTQYMLKKFLPRVPTTNINKLHPKAKLVYNRMIQKPLPLKFKLDEEKNNITYFQTLEILNKKQEGVTNEKLTFRVERTHTNNLPVFTEYRNNRSQKYTIIRHILGNIEDFKSEVEKITSNSEVELKTGVIAVKGLHSAKIKLWLARLGF